MSTIATSTSEQQKVGSRQFFTGLSVSIVLLAAFFAGGLADRLFVLKPLDFLANRQANPSQNNSEQSALFQNGLMQQDGVTVADVAEVASKSVISVSIQRTQFVPNSRSDFFGFDPFSPREVQEVQQDIGTGFVVTGGFVVTNKHVVSSDAQYAIIDAEGKEHKVLKIYRDPSIDLAIVQVEGLTSAELPLGDSDSLRVGEPVIAIGTALGEFRHTVTTGVISGLGRGITAGDMLSGFETLEGVIQTDAAINPGNSGGPLLNARGQVIGVNVATAQADNISFAIPINVIKSSLDNFNQTGQFDRPLLGVQYQTISEQAALVNEVPQGAYVVAVGDGTAAQEAGLQARDIITEFDGKSLKDEDLAALINTKKIGEKVSVSYWRAGETKKVTISLRASGS